MTGTKVNIEMRSLTHCVTEWRHMAVSKMALVPVAFERRSFWRTVAGRRLLNVLRAVCRLAGERGGSVRPVIV